MKTRHLRSRETCTISSLRGTSRIGCAKEPHVSIDALDAGEESGRCRGDGLPSSVFSEALVVVFVALFLRFGGILVRPALEQAIG
jgi:hypothetical protein